MNKLKGKKPVVEDARFQAVVYGNRGVGKTHFCCSFPNTYYIDTEGLSKHPHFVKMLEDNNSIIARINEMGDIIEEVKSLLSTKHEFKTLVIDSITFPFHLLANLEAERLEKQSKDGDGTAFGRNLAKAKRQTFELGMLITRLDMNCLITAHEKIKFEKNIEIGKVSDVSEKIEYALGSVINLRRIGEKVKAYIEKSRYTQLKTHEFLDFDSGYQILCDRLGKEIFEKEVKTEELASNDQLTELRRLFNALDISDEIVNKRLAALRCATIDQINKVDAQRMIDNLKIREGATA
jgi:hypothetical protein